MSAGPGLPADARQAGPRAGELTSLALSRRVLVVQDGQALVRSGQDGAELVFVSPAQAPDGIRLLLGVDADGVVYFGVSGPLPAAGETVAPPGPAGEAGFTEAAGSAGAAGGRPTSLRIAGPLLSDRDVGLMTHAVALANWHAVFTHCPQCGRVLVR